MKKIIFLLEFMVVIYCSTGAKVSAVKMLCSFTNGVLYEIKNVDTGHYLFLNNGRLEPTIGKDQNALDHYKFYIFYDSDSNNQGYYFVPYLNTNKRISTFNNLYNSNGSYIKCDVDKYNQYQKL